MARHCPRERDPMMRSEGVDDSGTGITPPVHLQRGGSMRLSWSTFHNRKGRVFRRGFGGALGMCCIWASARSSARLKSLPRGPGQLHGKRRGLAHVGFLLSLVTKGWMEMVMSRWRKHCMPRAPVNRVAWGRYLCFARDKRGRCKFRFGTKMRMCQPGWGPRERTPAMAASVAASMRSWLARKPRSMHVPSAKERKVAMKWSGCRIG